MSWKSALRQNRDDAAAMALVELDAVVPILVEVRRRTVDALIRLGDSSEFQSHSRRKVLAQLDDVASFIRDKLPASLASELLVGSSESASRAIFNTSRLIREGERRFRGSPTSLRLPEAKILAAVERSVATRHASSAARYAGDVGARIRREIAIGTIMGESISQMSARLLGQRRSEKLAGSPEKLAEEVADRQFFKNMSDAERLVRTELCGAYTETQLECLSEADTEDPGWMKMWDAASDRRVCQLCAALDGVAVMRDQLFPGGVRGPPLHPRDRCVLAPWRVDWGPSSSGSGLSMKTTTTKGKK